MIRASIVLLQARRRTGRAGPSSVLGPGSLATEPSTAATSSSRRPRADPQVAQGAAHPGRSRWSRIRAARSAAAGVGRWRRVGEPGGTGQPARGRPGPSSTVRASQAGNSAATPAAWARARSARRPGTGVGAAGRSWSVARLTPMSVAASAASDHASARVAAGRRARGDGLEQQRQGQRRPARSTSVAGGPRGGRLDGVGDRVEAGRRR